MKKILTSFTALLLLAGCDHAHDTHAKNPAHPHTHGPGCAHGHAEKPTPAHAHGPGCAHGHAETSTAQTAAPKADGAKVVTVPKSIQAVMGLTTVAAETRRLSATRVFTGRWELTPEARQTMATPVSGRVTLHVRALARVKKGETLFTVTSPDLIARANEIATLAKRVAVYRRLQTPNAELENTLAVKRAERAALLADAKEENGCVVVRAACDGLVETFETESGAWLATGATVLRLTDTRALRFTAVAAASDVRGVTDGQAASVDGHPGTVRLGIGDRAGAVPLHVVFPGGIDALAGARAEAVCVTGTRETPQTAVPTAAIVTVGLQPTVFVRDAHDGTRFIAVPVVPGEAANGWTAVEGLPSGTVRVVRDGAYELKTALAEGNSAPAGHFHADGTFHEGEH